MFGHQFYHSIIRDYIVVFGTLFNEIYIQRTDSSNNVIDEFKVPLSYGPKDKMLARVDADPTLSQQAAITLPRMSFELIGAQYDNTRKLNTIQRNRASSANGVTSFAYNPVPYNFTFQLAIAVKNAEDGTKIVEQILPFFTPEWNVTMPHASGINSTHDVPIILQSVSTEDQYTDNFETRRALLWNLDFVVKGYLYGPVKQSSIITQTIGSIFNIDGDVEIATTNNAVSNVSQITVSPGQTNTGTAVSAYGSNAAISGNNATAIASLANFTVSNITMVNKGNRYTNATVTIDSPEYANAVASATVSSNTISAVNVTTNGYYYASAPAVTIDPPQSNAITATGTTSISGNLVQIAVSNTGTYYNTNTTANVAVTKYHDGFASHLFRFGTSSYETGLDLVHDHTFLYPDSILYTGNFHTFFYVPNNAVLTGELVFKVNNTSNGDVGTYYGITIDEHVSNTQLATVAFVTDDGTNQSYGDITKDAWHFMSIRRRSAYFDIYMDGVEIASNIPTGTQDRVWNTSIDMINISGNTVGIHFDEIFLTSNTTAALTGYVPTVAYANGDLNVGPGGSGDATDYIRLVTDMENETETDSQSVVVTVSDGRVTAVANATFNNEVISANVTIADPDGTANDYNATATAVLTNGVVSSIVITSAGDFYTATPNVSVEAVNTSILVRATGTASIQGDEVDSINISNGGFGYITTPTVTISNSNINTLARNDVNEANNYGYITQVENDGTNVVG